MHKKRIQKFLDPGGGGILFTTPGVLNTGFNFLQLLSPFMSALTSKSTLTPNFGNSSFETMFPIINADANSGDPFATKFRADYNFREGLRAIADAAILKNPSNDKPIPSTFRSGGLDGAKTPFSQTKAGKGVAIGSLIVGMTSLFIPDLDKDVNTVDAIMKLVRGTGQQALMSSGNPILMGIGAGDMLIDKLGGHSDASQGLGTGTDIANAVGSLIPGAGWLAKKTKKYSMSDELKTSLGYGGLRDLGEKVARNAGANLLVGGSKQNDRRDAHVAKENIFLGIIGDAKDAQQASNYGGFSLGNQMTLAGGVRPFRVKNGAKLLNAREILNNYNKTVVVEDVATVKDMVEEFREGGKVNVIPGGQLHKNKHHMEDVGEEYKDLTTKGIPVVTEGEGGALVQQAEIERDEIIFNLDVTKKLEELMEDGSDEAALEAGKLLATEIMENTVDNTGLMKEIS